MAANAKRMGFLAANEPDKQAASRIVKEEEVLLRFDSGRVITRADATHHVLALGSTGTGKSQTVVYPSLLNLLKSGAFGLIIDIKGNMRGKIRALAETCGREGDLVEYGTSESASPLNLLNGMDRHQMRKFFELLTVDNFKGSTQSLDWHMKGVSAATDCGQLLRFLREKHANFDLDFRLIHDMLSDPLEGRKLYAFFKKMVFDPSRPDHASLVAAIDNNRFHALNIETTPRGRLSGDKNVDEQLTWILTGIRDGMRSFLDTPGIERNFCRPGAPGLELADHMLAGKIVVVRFDPATGPVGARLSRTILSHFYSRVFQLGLLLPKDKNSFVCVDEFQEVADLSSNRDSDSSFIALAREFNCIVMVVSQSMSSLLNRGDSAAAVLSFASNCNQKIIYYSDDPMTRELAARYDPNVNLADLKPGEAFVATYDQAARTHESGLETLNNAWMSVKDITDRGVSESLPSVGAASVPPSVMRGLVEWTETKMKEEDAQKRDALLKADTKAAAETAEKRQQNDEEESGMMEMEMSESARNLIGKFPDLFGKCEEDFCLPVGWVEYVEHALLAFRATGIRMKIMGMVFDKDGLTAIAESSSWRGYGTRILNGFLSGARKLCIICGNKLDEREDHRGMFVCPHCLEKFGLDMPDCDNDGDDEVDESLLDAHQIY